MRTFILCLFMTVLTFGLVVNDASAKRFGGGRSFGVQRSQSSLFKQNTARPASAFGQKSTGSKWGGFLGGALLGGLLASLFMGNGFFNGIMTWLLVGVVAFFIIGFFRKRMQPGFQSNQSNAFRQNSFSDFAKPFTGGGDGSSNNEEFSQYPAGFNAEEFLRTAKVLFIRLQTAYDQKNLQDLTTFTAPEVFAEIKMQLDERGDEPNTTEPVSLDAELLDVSKQSLSVIASVRFTGSMKENGESTQLDEIWHFRQFEPNGEWVVGGIQQEGF